MENETPQLKRLQHFMASCGVGSRRACEQIISEGRVAVNGRTVTTQGHKVDPERDKVTLDGRRITETREKVYIALNKPPGYICTNQDPMGRSLALDLLGGVAKTYRLFSVGRLDLLSSGLILYTNDGDFARSIAHPSNRIEKEYLVETKKPVAPELLDEFRKGILAGGIRYRIARYVQKTPTKVFIVLQEGKNRELRNMFAARRVQVRKIHRVRIGSIHLGELKSGEFRFLSQRETRELLKPAGSEPQKPRRRPGGEPSNQKRSSPRNPKRR